MLTYSQNFEDVMLARLFSEQQNGFYIDVGACHPEDLSVTKHFYDLGWKGINIEPIPKACSLFDKIRTRDVNLNLAIDITVGERLFYEVIKFDALSTFDANQAKFLREMGYSIQEYMVKTLGLNEIFDRYVNGTVDFLKIDVEGSEDSVLQSLDLSTYRPKVIIVEATQPARGFPGWDSFHLVSNWKWESRLVSSGYIFAHFDGISRFYVRSEDSHLVKRFEIPPGYFDDIHRPEEKRLAMQLEELASELSKLQSLGFIGRSKFLLSYIKHRAKQAIKFKLHLIAGHNDQLVLPKITVVTPVYNGEDYIAETIESVLSQDYPQLEYIIVDGGSTDNTMNIIRNFEANTRYTHKISLVISEPDHGMYDAIAKGLDNATGEIFCYLNSDDLFECGGLRSVGKYFAQNPNAQVIYHEDIVWFDGWKFPNIRQPKGISKTDLLCKHILFQDGVFFRRNAYTAVGGFNRGLRLAGDFDLWLRLSKHFRLVKRPDHVSCFRIRTGQLSMQMAEYYEEMQQTLDHFWHSAHFVTRSFFPIKKVLRLLVRRSSRKRKERLFFPININDLPTSVMSTACALKTIPKSPIDGKPAERLLFSTPDTRFGDNEINYVYLDSRNGVAICHPPMAPEKLDKLYRKYYSQPPTEMVMPKGRSPFRNFNRMTNLEKALLRLPVGIFSRWMFNAWSDNTLTELEQILIGSRVDTKNALRFLDAGCFEGQFLNVVREKTNWLAFGLEPNVSAVELARSHGHQVWQGHAENAIDIIPNDQQFDIIYMGQTIEHMDNPVLVLRQLRLLLAPGGVLVMSTPNLDSRQIDWFGPTWAHWHAPYHRYIFSRKGIRSLAHQVGLLPIKAKTFSHPYWTTMSIAQSSMGLGGSASHAVSFDRRLAFQAERIYFWMNIVWNRLGKGDYCYISLKDASND